MVATLARLFAERSVSATWATVGLLFASSAGEAQRFRPATRPRYERTELDPYVEPIGETEDEDPLHLAGSIVDLLAGTPGQEVASHTFSHYYCLEPGQDREAFRADLTAARAIAENRDVHLRSLVMPRNQWRADYADVVRACGFECYRGVQPGWATRARSDEEGTPVVRAARLADTYVGRRVPTFAWDELVQPSGLCNVPASAFLRPASSQTAVLEPLRRRRLTAAMRNAATRGRVLHLWWHPQNFVADPAANLSLLAHLLDEADRLRVAEGFTSQSMGGVVDTTRALSA
jgi:peptidoglycan/xylan/chitin deacetylase (PgdA/CDA1 family)